MSMILMGVWSVSLYRNGVKTLCVNCRDTQGKVIEEALFGKDYFSLGFLIRRTLRTEYFCDTLIKRDEIFTKEICARSKTAGMEDFNESGI